MANNQKEYREMNETELRDYQMWTMQDLTEYLLEIVRFIISIHYYLCWYLLSQGKIKDPKWLDNYLKPKFQESFIHTVRN